MNPKYLDNEEKELIEAFENVNSSEVFKPSEEDQKKFRNAAKEFITSEKKMNIRIDPYELEKIKERAAREGLRYQTFVKSVLHKYITGQLVEK
ncbi:CopG family antitoxin [Spirochaeta dissipatitropha]